MGSNDITLENLKKIKKKTPEQKKLYDKLRMQEYRNKIQDQDSAKIDEIKIKDKERKRLSRSDPTPEEKNKEKLRKRQSRSDQTPEERNKENLKKRQSRNDQTPEE